MRKNINFFRIDYLKRIVFTILIISTITIKAQTIQTDYNNNITKYTLASPDVYSFEKYELNPINKYVGKPEISIPIYTIKTGGIEYPINLVYNAGGIKVDQLASDVGLGWSLTSSVITRTINGDNDFDNLGSLNLQSDYSTYSSTDQNQNFLSSAYGTLGRISPKIGYFLQKQTNHKIDNIGHSIVDFIPDTYHFYADGYSSNFFFNNMDTPIELDGKGTFIQALPSKRRIETNRGYYNLNSVWIPNYNFLTQDFFNIYITTNTGLKYTFSDCDFSINQMIKNNIGATIVPYDSAAQISAWHVTSIEDKNTGKRVDFVYENTSSNPNGSNQVNGFDQLAAQKQYEYISSPQQNPSNTLCSYYSNLNGFWDTYTLNESARVDIQKKRLKQIIFDQGSINFSYNTAVREDIYNGDYITKVTINDKNNNVIKSYDLVYDYFISTYNVGEFNPSSSQNNYRYKRLKLMSFGETGKPTYKFYYNEMYKLPPVNSFAIDFLGYYNGSTDISTPIALTSTRANPTLYYYPNNFDKSLLPFPVPNVAPATTILGIFNRESNEIYAKAWSLNKVVYPTSGFTEYNYESNQFDVFGQNVNGGGLRIANQILNDGFGASRMINYTYVKDASLATSGTMNSFPFFGHPTIAFFNLLLQQPTIPYPSPPEIFSTDAPPNISNTVDWKMFEKSNLNTDITSGSYVGYSRVLEREIGKGSIEYKYTSNDIIDFKNYIHRYAPPAGNDIFNLYFGNGSNNCISEFIIANSAMGTNIFTDNSYKRGKLLEENIFSESNQLLKKIGFQYNENLINNTYSFQNGITIPYVDNLSGLMTLEKTFKIAQFLPTSKTVSTYDSLGNQSNEITNFTYNSKGFLTTKEGIVSNGDSNKVQYFYPQDTQITTSEPFMNNLITNNILATPIYTQVYRNTENIAEEKIVYANDATTNNIPMPKYVYAKKNGTNAVSTLEKKITYDLYDDKGNLVQYTLANGTPVTLVWGYNKTLLIAKIENATYTSVTSLITAAQTASNTGTESALITSLSSLRNNALLANAFVTSYTYIPLKGISTATDPKGYIMYYYYDGNGRLIYVKDAAGNYIKENQYNYKP